MVQLDPSKLTTVFYKLIEYAISQIHEYSVIIAELSCPTPGKVGVFKFGFIRMYWILLDTRSNGVDRTR